MDLDGDGLRDVITGSWPGELHVFRGTDGGAFAPATTLRDRVDQEMKFGSASTVFAADWDRDGDLDLVIGDIQGHVWRVRNESGSKELAFAQGEMLEVEGQQLLAPGGDSAPVLADWDGDGTLDLIVGAGDGSVRWFPNAAASGAPSLGAPRELIPAHTKTPTDGSLCGRRAKPHVVDWNGDGYLDLLVGDFHMTPPERKELTDEDEFRLAGLQAEVEALQRLMRPIGAEVARVVLEEMGIELPAEGGVGAALRELAEEQRKEYAERTQAAYRAHARMQLLQKRLQVLVQEQAPLGGRPQVHGRVWLFLRRAPSAATVTKEHAVR